jgi:polyisoprenoid-binding protein YceI
LKHFIPFVLAAALPFSALAADTYVLDPSHTFPSFEVSHLGFSVHRGRFNRTSGKAVLDLPAKGGSIEVVIDVASVDTGGEKLEAHLKAEDFFNAEKYPTMTFTSDKLRFEGDNLVGADGFLAMRGITRPVSLAVQNFKCGAHPYSKKAMCGANVTTTIKRSDFDMKYGLPAVGDEVRIAIQIEAYKS